MLLYQIESLFARNRGLVNMPAGQPPLLSALRAQGLKPYLRKGYGLLGQGLFLPRKAVSAFKEDPFRIEAKHLHPRLFVNAFVFHRYSPSDSCAAL